MIYYDALIYLVLSGFSGLSWFPETVACGSCDLRMSSSRSFLYSSQQTASCRWDQGKFLAALANLGLELDRKECQVYKTRLSVLDVLVFDPVFDVHTESWMHPAGDRVWKGLHATWTFELVAFLQESAL